MSFDRNFGKWSLAGRQRERRGQEMKMPILARLVAAGAMLAAAAGAAAAQAPKPSKHGIIAPKADAGFLLMAAKRGFAEREGLKLELLEVKIMGCHWVVVPHGIMVKAGIDKMEDLKGKAIAVSAPGSFPDMLARVALAKFNIAPSDV